MLRTDLLLITRSESFFEEVRTVAAGESLHLLCVDSLVEYSDAVCARRALAVLISYDIIEADYAALFPALLADCQRVGTAVFVLGTVKMFAHAKELLELGVTDLLSRPVLHSLLPHRLHQLATGLQYSAEFDVLTDCYNQEGFLYHATHLLAQNAGQDYVLLRWNIEQFKLINELYGKPYADQILCDLAEMLRDLAQRDGICGRLHADHFVLLLPKSQFQLESILQKRADFIVAQKIRDALSLTIGIYEPDDNTLPVELMCDRANLALHTVKQNCMVHYAFFDVKLHQKLIQEQEVLGEMEYALAAHQFHIYIQPVYSAAENRPVSGEVLVRWLHPDKGMVSPGRFIPVFERTGFISKLDYYVWEETCRYLRKRMDEGLPQLPLSVNVSRMSMYNADLGKIVSDLMEKYRIPPALFRLEITESAYTDNPMQLLSTLQELQEKGHLILMDDFGSGYSSLNALKEIPVDILKIDMKFISDFQSSKKTGTILTAVVRMAKWLNLPVIAEGVETLAQVDFLRSIGCEKIQGYYYAKPMPLPEFEAHLLEHAVGTQAAKATAAMESTDLDELLGGNQLVSTLMESMVSGCGLYEFVNDQLEIIRANDSYVRILGTDTREVVRSDSNVFAYVHPNDCDKLLRACNSAVKTGQSVSCTIRREAADNTMLHLECMVRRVSGAAQRPLLCIAFNDITNRIQLERKLREEQERFQIVADYSGTIILDWNAREGLTFVSTHTFSQYVLSTIPKTANFLMNHYYLKPALHPDDFPLLRLLLQRIEHGENHVFTTLRLKKKTGEYCWCNLTYNCIRGVDGSLIRILSTIQDVDRQKKQELAEKETLYRSQQIMDHMMVGAGLYEVGDEIEMIYSNPYFYENNGYCQQELEDNPMGALAIIHPEDRAQVREMVFEAAETGAYISYDFRILTHSKQIRWHHIAATELPEMKHGDRHIYLATFTDITSLMEKTAQLQLIMDNMSGGVLLYKRAASAYQMVYANPVFYQMCSRTPQVLQNNHMDAIFDILVPEDRKKITDYCKRLAEKPTEPTTVEYRVQEIDGAIAWHRCCVKVIGTNGTDDTSGIMLLTDITSEKVNEQEHRIRQYANTLFFFFDEVFLLDAMAATIRLLHTKMEWSSAFDQAIPLSAIMQMPAWGAVGLAYQEALAEILNVHLISPDAWADTTDAQLELEVELSGKPEWISVMRIYMGDGKFLLANQRISDRKKTQQLALDNALLQERNYAAERYRIISERSGTAVFEWNMKTGEFFSTESFRNFVISQKQPDSLLNMTATFDGVYPEDVPAVVQFIDRKAAKPVNNEVIARFQVLDGTYKWVRMTSNLVFDAEGKPARNINTLTIIHAEMEAKLQLQETMQKLENMIAVIPAGILILQILPTLQLNFISAQARALLQCDMQTPLSEMLEILLLHLFPDMDCRDVVLQAEKSGQSYAHSSGFIDAAGMRHWIRLAGKPIRSENNELHCYVTLHDITDEVERDRAMRRKTKAHQLVLEQSDLMVFDYNLETGTMEFSYLDAERKRETMLIPDWMHQDAATMHVRDGKPLCDCLRAASVRMLSGTVDYEANYLQEEFHWYRAHYKSISDDEQHIFRIVGTIQDIEHEKQLEQHAREKQKFLDIMMARSLFVCEFDFARDERNLLAADDSMAEQFYDWTDYVNFLEHPDLFHSSDTRKCYELWNGRILKQRFDSGNLQNSQQYRIKKRNGDWVWVQTSMNLLYCTSETDIRGLCYTELIDENKKIEEALRLKAEFDSLTGVYNRATTEELVTNSLLANAAKLSVFVMCDVDNFKTVNDTYGHPIGDAVLLLVARSMQTVCRKTDVVGRIGGDEFVMLFKEVGTMELVIEKLERMRQLLREESLELTPAHPVTVSIGISRVMEGDRTFHDIVCKADIALYATKKKGKNGYSVYPEHCDSPDAEHGGNPLSQKFKLDVGNEMGHKNI